MKKRNLYIAWGVLYIFCTALAFIPAKEVGYFALCMVLSLGFFVPPAMLLYRAAKRGDLKTVRLIRTLSACSLGATLVVLVLNILTVGATAAAGELMYWLLIIVSSPMICMQIRGISLFLWACLLFAAIRVLKRQCAGKKEK